MNNLATSMQAAAKVMDQAAIDHRAAGEWRCANVAVRTAMDLRTAAASIFTYRNVSQVRRELPDDPA